MSQNDCNVVIELNDENIVFWRHDVEILLLRESLMEAVKIPLMQEPSLEASVNDHFVYAK